jgi:hypothetical protein
MSLRPTNGDRGNSQSACGSAVNAGEWKVSGVRCAALIFLALNIGFLGGAALMRYPSIGLDAVFHPLRDRIAYAGAVDRVFSITRERVPALRSFMRDIIMASDITVQKEGPVLRQAFLDLVDKTGRIAALGADSLVLVTHLYGLTVRSLWLRAPGGSDDARTPLLIYHAGHEGNPLEDRSVLQLIEATMKRGVDVLLLTMPGIDFNWDESATIPTRMGDLQIWSRMVRSHEVLALFYDAGNPGRSGAGVLLSSNDAFIREVIAEGGYDDVTLAGLSGGGWATTMYAALNPDIDRSLSFNGTVPMHFRTVGKNIGDYEQYADPLYRNLGYWELYTLATLDAAGRATRTHRQIYNDGDPCCFDGTTARAIQEVYELTAKQPGLSFEIIESDKHQMHPSLILDAVGGGRPRM